VIPKGMLRTTTLFALFALAVAALNAGALAALVRLASNNPTVSHVVGIPFVAAVLLYLNRDVIFARPRPSVGIGSGIAAAGLVVARGARAFGDGPDLLALAIAGLVVSWIGGFVAFYGVASARAALFPLLFLVFMIPLPSVVVDAATGFLKAGSAEAVAGLFRLTGTPFYREGFVFSLPTVVIEIADECSGIRSSIALFMTSLIAGYTFLQNGWAKTLLALAIFPAALLKNAIRIVTLSLLSIHVDPSFLTGQLHHEGGVVFFLLALGLLTPLFVSLRWFERSRKPAVAR
jgi:exosortase